MKISVIMGHPKRGSFNHAIAGTVVPALKTGRHELAFHDLY
jgi:NAD(P)H-dependent FMN reductase